LHSIQKLIPVLEQARLSTFSGFTFRVIADRWRASPLSAIGALQRGGRYNPPGEFTVLYTADSQFTALREVEALFLDEAGELRGVPRNPDLILTLECSLLSVLDLTESGMLKKLGTTYEELAADSPSRFIESATAKHTHSTAWFSLLSQRSHLSHQGPKRSQSSCLLHRHPSGVHV
jgi:RES domain-containing protein